MVRILPIAEPTTMVSPTSKVPRCTSIDTTGPLVLSSFASITVPLDCLFGFAFNSFTSATNNTISNKVSILSLFLADISTKMVSPPHSSGTNSYFINSCFTFSGLAPSTSILFSATTIGISAALAWLIASMV